MRAAIFFVVCLAAANAFHFGHLFSHIKDTFNHIGHDIHNDVEKVSDAFKHIDNLVEDAKDIPEEIKKALGSKFMAEAEKIAKDVKVAIPCIQAIIKNKDAFEVFNTTWSDLEKTQFWDQETHELYTVAVACTGQPQKFQWLEKIDLTADDAIVCADDIETAIDAGKQLPEFFKSYDLSIVKNFINDIVDVSKQCPAVYNQIKNDTA